VAPEEVTTMRIAIRFRGIEASDVLRDRVLHRTRLRLQRFGDEVTDVMVRVADVSGSRGGVERLCRVTVRGPQLGSVTTELLAPQMSDAIDAGIDRAARSVTRRLSWRRLDDAREPWPPAV
jgi:hypothetical protein